MDFLKNRFFQKIGKFIKMGYAVGLNSHVASICPIRWTKKLTFVPTRTTTRACLAGALFFQTKYVPYYWWHCIFSYHGWLLNFGLFSLKQVPKIQERVFFEKKEPLLGKPEESSPSWFSHNKKKSICWSN